MSELLPRLQEIRTANVLLVEDDPRLCTVMQALIEEDTRLQIVAALPTAGQAIAYALSHDVDVVILDHHLADGASGIEAAETIRSSRPEVRIVLSTADVDVDGIDAPGVTDAVVSKQHLIHLLDVVQGLLGLEAAEA